MTKTVLTTNEQAIQSELNKIESNAAKFQRLFDAMIKHGYEPTLKEFRTIVSGRNLKRDNPLEDFLREKTVKKHPSIDTLPITDFMKRTMIVLPVECEEITRLYNAIPPQREVLRDVHRIEFNGGKIVVSESVVNEIKESHSIYAKPEQLAVYEKVNNALNVLKQLQAETGVNIFRQGVVINTIGGNLATAEVNPHAILQMP
jgi:hypothetical protein